VSKAKKNNPGKGVMIVLDNLKNHKAEEAVEEAVMITVLRMRSAGTMIRGYLWWFTLLSAGTCGICELDCPEQAIDVEVPLNVKLWFGIYPEVNPTA
jgi:hypothetical protein